MTFQQLPGKVQFYATNLTTPSATIGPGTGTFAVWSAVSGLLAPYQAGAVVGQTYPYFAQSADGSEWEQGSGVYGVSGLYGTLTRAKIAWTSNEDVQPVNFTSLPIVVMFPASTGFPTTGVFTVATLPAASGNQSARAMVTDANATTFGSIVAGGGANIVPVFCDGTNWKIG